MNQFFNFSFFLETVLPKLIFTTMVSAIIALVVGGGIGWIVTAIARKKSRTSGHPAQSLVYPAIFGCFVGMMLIGLLPIEANPASLVGGPYGGLWYFITFIFLAPTGSLVGTVAGLLVGGKLSPARQKKVGKWGLAVTYLIAVTALYFCLVPPALRMTQAKGAASDPLSVQAEISGYEQGVKALAFSPDGKSLAITTTDGVHLWDLAAQRVKKTFIRSKIEPETLKNMAQKAVFSANGQQLYSVASQGIEVRDLKTGEVTERLEGGNEVYPTADGEKLLGMTVLDPYAPKTSDTASQEPEGLHVWDLKTYQRLQTIPGVFRPWEGLGIAIALSQDSHTLALSPDPNNNLIEVWDLESGKRVKSLNGNGGAFITAMAITPDSKQLVTAAAESLFLWDLDQNKLLRTIPKAGKVQVMALFPPSGLVTKANNQLSLWDLKTGKSIKTISRQGEDLSAVGFSPESKAIALYSYADKRVKILRL